MEHLNRRSISMAILGSAIATLAACKEQSGSNQSPDEALSSLSGAISSLQSAVARFSDDNWRDVVPDVQADATNVADAFTALKKAMGKE